MPYIGNPIYQSAFVTDTFSGNGSTTTFTMSVAPAGTTNVLVAISGVLQDPSTYGVVGTTITFSAAPPTGTGNISCRYLGVPVTGVATTAYRTVTEFTATAGQTTFTPPSYTVGFINVYRNGVLLGSADYTATNGTTVVLTTGATAGDLVTVESFLVSSVLNALPQSGGTISGNLVVTGTETVPTITSPSATALTIQSANTTAITIDTSQNVGIGTASPTAKLQVTGLGSSLYVAPYASGVDIASSGQLNPHYQTEFNLYTGVIGSGTKRATLDSSGRMTTPYQTAFSAGGTNGGSKTSGTVLNFTTVGSSSPISINIGTNWSNATSRFTAPVAGIYSFYCAVYIQNATAAAESIAPCINGSQLSTAQDTFMLFQGLISGTDNLATAAFILNLAANDYVDLRVRSGSNTITYYAGHSWFQGYLLG